jgi:hypothetical protein
VSNGGFETGDFSGWTVTDQALGSGTFFINANDGSAAPLSGVGGALAINPGGGGFFALSDQTGPGTHALTQSLLAPIGTSSLMFSFDMFMNDFSGGLNPTVDPGGLDYTVGATNQHARIDILTATAAALSTAPADIITSILAPVPAPAISGGINPWVSSGLIDLSAFISAGDSFQVRFAETDNSGFLTLAVDNVSVIADVTRTTPVPLPATLWLFGAALAGLGLQRRMR